MVDWVEYRRISVAEMRVYTPGEDLSGISVSAPDAALMNDDPEEFARGMIARNPVNHADQWYVSRAYFTTNFAEMEAAGSLSEAAA